jgi:hypothetical protein
VPSSIIFVLETRTIQELKILLKKIEPRGDGKKKCFSFGPPIPTSGLLERVWFGQKILFLIFVI